MRRKVSAFVMIAIMALTVCGAVAVTTPQKAAATPANTQPTPIVITYKPGATYVFRPIRFNNDGTNYELQDPAVSYPTTIGAAVAGGAESSWVRYTSPTQTAGANSWVGVLFKLNLNGADWNTIRMMPCKVTFHLTYLETAKGDAQAAIIVNAGRTFLFWQDVQGSGAGQHTQADATTLTTTVPLAGIFDFNQPGYPGVWGGALVGAGVTGLPNGAGGQATAIAICDYITIQFPHTAG
jgi:hypothetical protein